MTHPALLPMHGSSSGSSSQAGSSSLFSPTSSLSAQPSNISLIPHSTASTNTQPSQQDVETPTCKPSLPESMKRYKRAVAISSPTSALPSAIPPGRLSLQRHGVSGWEPVVHPEGALYYRKNVNQWIVLTDTDLTNQTNCDEVNLSVESLIEGAENLRISPSDNFGLVVELSNENPRGHGKQETLYYFVDHEAKLLFWVHEFSRAAIKADLCGGVKFVSEGSHIKYAIEAQYWLHCERFSNTVPMRPEYLNDLRETLIHASTDSLLSDTSLAPFASEDLLKMLDVVAAIKDSIENSKSHAHSMSAIARMMRLFTHSKFLNFFGQPGARLDADQSVYTKRRASEEGYDSPLFNFMNFFLFNAPRMHAQTLRRIYVDQVINAPRWKGFIGGLKDEWNGFTIFSTVLLAVDISFLAVPNVINDYYQTPTAVAIYVSTMTSLCTLVVSIVLADQIRRYEIESVDEGAAYMARITHLIFGIEALAVMYSLPYALLVWSMVAFAVALSMMVFSSQDKATLAVMAPLFGIVMILTAWPIIWSQGRQVSERRHYHTR